jgi:HAD superfamily hydrolase (TIGR01509 family)
MAWHTQISAVVLDLDGVLADTEGVWLRAKQLASAQMGLALDAAFVEARQGYGLRRFADDLQLTNGLPVRLDVTDRFEQIADTFAMDHYQNRLKMKPGARDFVLACRSSGLPLGLCSNCPMRFIDTSLTAFGIAGMFDAVVSTHALRRPKPDPAGYIEVCRLLDVRPALAVAIEDTVSGATAAKGAGLGCIGFGDGAMDRFAFCDMIASDFTTIAEALGLVAPTGTDKSHDDI